MQKLRALFSRAASITGAAKTRQTGGISSAPASTAGESLDAEMAKLIEAWRVANPRPELDASAAIPITRSFYARAL